MSRYIDIDDISLRKTISVGGLSAKALWRRIQQEPSIDLVRCKECKWASPNGKYGCMLKPFSENDWQYHHLFADDFCSYGERRSDE